MCLSPLQLISNERRTEAGDLYRGWRPPLSVQSGSRAFVTHSTGTTRTIFHYTRPDSTPRGIRYASVASTKAHQDQAFPSKTNLRQTGPEERERRESRGSHHTFESTSTKKASASNSKKNKKDEVEGGRAARLDIISTACAYRTRPDLDLFTSGNLQEKSQGSQMCHNSRKEALSSVNTLNTLIFPKTNICGGALRTASTHIGRQMDFLWGRFVLKALK